jgi:hypothetical protein
MESKPQQAGPSTEVQALLERIAFLEEQITELRRASMLEKARLTPRHARGKTMLRRLVRMRPLMRPIEDLLRRLRAKP